MTLKDRLCTGCNLLEVMVPSMKKETGMDLRQDDVEAGDCGVPLNTAARIGWRFRTTKWLT